MKIALVVGHNVRSPGAVRVTDGLPEFIWCGQLAEMMAQCWPSDIRVFRRQPNPAGYKAEIGAAYDEVDEWGANVSCEMHFNGSASATANGTETWYATSAGKAVAEKVQAGMLRALGLRDRGIKKAGPSMVPGVDGTRGYESLISGKCPAVLIEPYFGSNAEDCRAADLRRSDLARSLYAALSGAVTAPVPSPPPATVETRLAAIEARLAALEAR